MQILCFESSRTYVTVFVCSYKVLPFLCVFLLCRGLEDAHNAWELETMYTNTNFQSLILKDILCYWILFIFVRRICHVIHSYGQLKSLSRPAAVTSIFLPALCSPNWKTETRISKPRKVDVQWNLGYNTVCTLCDLTSMHSVFVQLCVLCKGRGKQGTNVWTSLVFSNAWIFVFLCNMFVSSLHFLHI